MASLHMTTRDDIALSTMHFVPCLLQVLLLSWILRWSSVLSTQSSRSSKSQGAAAYPLVRFGGRRGNFQLKATIYCSKSRVTNCIVRETARYPATARGSGRSVGAATGGLMQRRQGVCVSISIRAGSRLPSAALRSLTMIMIMMLCLLVLGWAAMASAQVNTATLSGTVSDPQGLTVKGARVTVTNA